ncbi:MAG: acetoin utilization protein AcuC [Frankiales bacterium]|nr:acetoin utilization protein AcuC [Frankiales bacterium]
MTGQSAVVWDDELAAYDFGPGHPLAPIRVQLAMRLARDLGLLEGDDVTVVPPDPVDDDMLRTVHDAEYVESVRASSADPARHDLHRGLGTDDVPTFRGMHEASRDVCGATLAAVRAVHEGRALHALNLAGGLHHAMPGAASGFCVYNDLALGIRWLLDQGVERIAYVDVDVHHGDGVQAAFWDDPRVLTISIHESGRALFPGTGFPMEVGGPDAIGYAVNVALPPGIRDDGWLRAFDGVVPPLLREFAPEILVTQQGCDTHEDDPLAHLALSVDGQRTTYHLLHELAHEVAGGRWVATGGGGYSWIDVVPRAWAHLAGEVVGRPVPPETPVPASWRTFVEDLLKVPTPALMTDGVEPRTRSWASGYDPADPVDAAVLRTREAVFPWHGLAADPYHGF